MKKLNLLALALSLCLLPLQRAQASGLTVTYGNSGVKELTYNGVVLENVTQHPSDAFHIWHMKATSLSGVVETGASYTWGETNLSRAWNPINHTWTYRYIWGTIAVLFVQSGDKLDLNVVTTNSSSSNIIFDGATIYPFALHFPELPKGFTNSAYQQLAFNTTGPSVTLADFGAGEVAAVTTGGAKPLYTGFEPAGSTNAYVPIISGTAIDNMASFFPHNDRPLLPGQTDAYTVSLRFGPSGTPAAMLASDVYAAWAKSFPPKLQWSDRRIIGTAYLASSPSGNPNVAKGYPNNPRRYFNDSNAGDFDIRTSTGLTNFQNRILAQAQNITQNLEKLSAQGVITWDLEGEAYPQPTSYACAPDQIAQLSPEMESVITSAASPYRGMKLDDAYFKTIKQAGFRVGVCVRPQHYTFGANGTASQVAVPDTEVAAELLRKMRYAHSRWGATLFYVDSSVESNGGTLPVSIFRQVAASMPDSLIIPEETTPAYYAYTAPFQSFLFHADTGTPADVYNYYPKAFSVNLVNDVDPNKLTESRNELTAAVRRGDILMVHADYWQANNPTVVQMFLDAGRTATSMVP